MNIHVDSTLEVAPCEENFVLPLGFRLCSYVYINTISLIWLVLGKISFLMQVQLAGKLTGPDGMYTWESQRPVDKYIFSSLQRSM